MRIIALIAASVLCATSAIGQTAAPKAPAPATAAPAAPPTCKAQAAEKKLAGAALKSFMSKCQKDAGAACTKSADEKKLAGAAKKSFTTKCTADAVGS
jgi:hypothetical protein